MYWIYFKYRLTGTYIMRDYIIQSLNLNICKTMFSISFYGRKLRKPIINADDNL